MVQEIKSHLQHKKEANGLISQRQSQIQSKKDLIEWHEPTMIVYAIFITFSKKQGTDLNKHIIQVSNERATHRKRSPKVLNNLLKISDMPGSDSSEFWGTLVPKF